MTKMLQTKADFDAFIAADKLSVVDFYATWCGPCRMIGPKVEAMATDFPDVQFAKVDVDENDETAEECEISAMPTFHLYRGGKKVATFTGANEQKLRELVIEHK